MCKKGYKEILYPMAHMYVSLQIYNSITMAYMVVCQIEYTCFSCMPKVMYVGIKRRQEGRRGEGGRGGGGSRGQEERRRESIQI